MTSSPIRPDDRPFGADFRHFRYDLISGFFVFLIALPLCLGISIASGYPPIAGVFTAIVGGLVAPLISNSELTIKGPAAGLIAIAIGAITDFQQLAQQAGVEDPAFKAYQLALAVGVAAGVVQIVFGLCRAGVLVEFFPMSAVHGMLAAIGIIIFSKQSHLLFGQKAQSGNALACLAELPQSIAQMNPVIFLIGAISLAIMFGLPAIKHPWAKKLPAPLLVLLAAVPLGWYFGLQNQHAYSLFGRTFELTPEKFLVRLFDARTPNLLQAITLPDFAAFTDPRYLAKSLQYVVMFALVGSLESLLSAKAIDLLDPWKRKANFNRELLAIGVANTAVACVGGLPMISEIVRSSANIHNGARTRWSNACHGAFLLAFVLLLPGLIEMIPLAALAAMLVYTGFRLASPKEFVSTFRIGREQLGIFLVTIIVTLAEDLLLGIAAGILTKLIIHHLNGASAASFFRLHADVERRGDGTNVIHVRESAIFSNWIGLKNRIERLGFGESKNVLVDLRATKLVDHTVVEKLHAMQCEFDEKSLHLELIGLEGLRHLSPHPMSAMKRGLVSVRRITIYANKQVEELLCDRFVAMGVASYRAVDLETDAAARSTSDAPRQRMEIFTPFDLADQILEMLEQEILHEHQATVCVENVMVLRPDLVASVGGRQTVSNHSGAWEAGSPL